MRPLPLAVDCIGTAHQRSVDAARLRAVVRPFGSYRSDFSCQHLVLAVFWPCFDDFDRLISQRLAHANARYPPVVIASSCSATCLSFRISAHLTSELAPSEVRLTQHSGGIGGPQHQFDYLGATYAPTTTRCRLHRHYTSAER